MTACPISSYKRSTQVLNYIENEESDDEDERPDNQHGKRRLITLEKPANSCRSKGEFAPVLCEIASVKVVRLPMIAQLQLSLFIGTCPVFVPVLRVGAGGFLGSAGIFGPEGVLIGFLSLIDRSDTIGVSRDL